MCQYNVLLLMRITNTNKREIIDKNINNEQQVINKYENDKK